MDSTTKKIEKKLRFMTKNVKFEGTNREWSVKAEGYIA